MKDASGPPTAHQWIRVVVVGRARNSRVPDRHLKHPRSTDAGHVCFCPLLFRWIHCRKTKKTYTVFVQAEKRRNQLYVNNSVGRIRTQSRLWLLCDKRPYKSNTARTFLVFRYLPCRRRPAGIAGVVRWKTGTTVNNRRIRSQFTNVYDGVYGKSEKNIRTVYVLRTAKEHTVDFRRVRGGRARRLENTVGFGFLIKINNCASRRSFAQVWFCFPPENNIWTGVPWEELQDKYTYTHTRIRTR